LYKRQVLKSFFLFSLQNCLLKSLIPKACITVHLYVFLNI
jgi:hypothetical protein